MQHTDAVVRQCRVALIGPPCTVSLTRIHVEQQPQHAPRKRTKHSRLAFRRKLEELVLSKRRKYDDSEVEDNPYLHKACLSQTNIAREIMKSRSSYCDLPVEVPRVPVFNYLHLMQFDQSIAEDCVSMFDQPLCDDWTAVLDTCQDDNLCDTTRSSTTAGELHAAGDCTITFEDFPGSDQENGSEKHSVSSDSSVLIIAAASKCRELLVKIIEDSTGRLHAVSCMKLGQACELWINENEKLCKSGGCDHFENGLFQETFQQTTFSDSSREMLREVLHKVSSLELVRLFVKSLLDLLQTSPHTDSRDEDIDSDPVASLIECIQRVNTNNAVEREQILSRRCQMNLRSRLKAAELMHGVETRRCALAKRLLNKLKTNPR